MKHFLLLFHINMDQASWPDYFFLPLDSAHMFLFKGNSADYHDWCSPPLQFVVQQLTPTAIERRSFLWIALLIFHKETSPFLHSHSPAQPAATSFHFFHFVHFSPTFLFMPLIQSRREMLQPQQTFSFPCLFLFWFIPMFLGPLLWAGGRLSYMASHLGRCTLDVHLPSDWSGVSRWQHTGLTVAATKWAAGFVRGVP